MCVCVCVCVCRDVIDWVMRYVCAYCSLFFSDNGPRAGAGAYSRGVREKVCLSMQSVLLR